MVFDIHPNEFIDESGEPRSIERRSANPVKYLLQDLVRSKLKVKNLGADAIPLYESLISFYDKEGYSFITIKGYGENQNI